METINTEKILELFEKKIFILRTENEYNTIVELLEFEKTEKELTFPYILYINGVNKTINLSTIEEKKLTKMKNDKYFKSRNFMFLTGEIFINLFKSNN